MDYEVLVFLDELEDVGVVVVFVVVVLVATDCELIWLGVLLRFLRLFSRSAEMAL